ncbi:peptidoglycan DD-metalloendopeptidase family protein [Bordetella avium]|uniref:Peptidoglycan-binding peptidase n=1 Tax=Bordetella avium (strain 197N) TaxID=360910 RepID=Q2L010_BORA1|nr:peptidoglycan DD-metalloendopeptidase family protein [Bordetella avium]AZY49311.1 LysM peptidoglycan-binding domain-containing protein [Bordetella avium]AZY52666.1 LysM peptidoglycan-binding domain-containing protein [Bordetella avium]RIQ12791.1 LysM peptidoglycan-binding domain-containing protein [Bordetella avium]RIQ19172.1 LysM peptidoglycan-binding domain-containing protein [Bordetella avium]RIQ32084.1 LysM peptidoglycan-binding domain-containing protein [Bordetella avium]
MLNGQSLLAVFFAVPQRPLRLAGVLGLLALAGCASKGPRAPVVDLTNQPAAATAAPAQGSYVVKPGDTLYKIARSNNVDIDTIKRLNSLSDPNQIHVGQVLKLSGGTVVASSGAQAITGGRIPAKPLEPVESSPEPVSSEPTPAPSTPPPAEIKQPARAADANVISWGWPSHGQIIQTFNSSSKGIDFAGNPGDAVLAAADGKVMYSGNGVRGLGNLIIINHQNGFITAYAHNRTLLVKTGQDVKRGAKVAELGQSDASSPKLHFEIRRQGTPVDPMQYLPAR